MIPSVLALEVDCPWMMAHPSTTFQRLGLALSGSLDLGSGGPRSGRITRHSYIDPAPESGSMPRR
jgi:hypothetical protein